MDLQTLKARLVKRNERRKKYGSPAYSAGAWNPEHNGKRWLEDIDRSGLRFKGYADKVAERISHKGWYSNSFCDEVYRGAVLQLPAHHGQSRFLPAYADPVNPGAYLVKMEIYNDETDCAYRADKLAEDSAEESRNHDEAWQAGREWADLKKQEAEDRTALLELCGEAKFARREDTPNICATIRAKIKSLYDSIQKSRKKRAELADNVWRDYKDTFNDGAEESVV